MEGLDSLKIIIDMLPLLIPLFIIQMALLVIALVDVVRREHVRGNKIVWILVIVLVNVIGPIVYLLFGRQEAPIDRD
jgi:uncharacterized membrane protein YhaH (DUF805 family)